MALPCVVGILVDTGWTCTPGNESQCVEIFCSVQLRANFWKGQCVPRPAGVLQQLFFLYVQNSMRGMHADARS